MFRPCLTALAAWAALASAAWAGDPACYTPQRDCDACRHAGKHCRHHCCWCEPPPQGPVVASFPAFPVAAFPLNYSAPASYTLNLAPPSQAAIDELQRALDAAKAARSPASCNGQKSPQQAPLAAPRVPADGVEVRVEQLETDMRSLERSVKELIELVKAREGK